MYPDISHALADSHVMFYHPAWPAQQLTPVCVLDQCLTEINMAMAVHGPDVASWSSGVQNYATKLVRVNWIYQRLNHEPIRKPILVHRHQKQMIVDCGDTRLMCISLSHTLCTVSILITDRTEYRARYQNWTEITNSQDLRTVCGFSDDAVVLFRSCARDHAIDWLEIGDTTTHHHLHDEDQRWRMINAYVQQCAPDFRFDQSWCRSNIDWHSYDRS